MKPNILIAHGGGPTAVINSSLYGAIEEIRTHEEIGAIYGALGGSAGILEENFIDFRTQPQEKIDLLPFTPASAIGTSRTPLYEKEYNKMLEVFKKHNIKYVLFNGGNGSMDTCGNIYKVAAAHDIKVIGIPKTIDNDIAVTDHCPGFGSAARYLATSVAEVGQDVKSMPIHVCIIEAMGRNAGWITASSALARKKEGDAPHLVYLPERPFNEQEFLEDVKKLYDKLGGVVVVVSEGLKNEKGEPIVPPIFKTGRATYYGDVSAHLATLVIKELGIKARSEKPGILGRSSISLQSSMDREEAIQAGAFAAKSVLEGKTGAMVGFKRKSNVPYQCEMVLISIEEVMMHERTLPDKYITPRGNDVTHEFINWCKPLIGENLPEYAEFR